jgi:hypothetical protein
MGKVGRLSDYRVLCASNSFVCREDLLTMKFNVFVLLVASAMTGSAFAQSGGTSDSAGSGSTTNTRQGDTEPHHDYGWLGLLGLIGLAGLRRQHHTVAVDNRKV